MASTSYSTLRTTQPLHEGRITWQIKAQNEIKIKIKIRIRIEIKRSKSLKSPRPTRHLLLIYPKNGKTFACFKEQELCRCQRQLFPGRGWLALRCLTFMHHITCLGVTHATVTLASWTQRICWLLQLREHSVIRRDSDWKLAFPGETFSNTMEN